MGSFFRHLVPGRPRNKRPSGNTGQPDFLQVFSSSPGVLESLETFSARLKFAERIFEVVFMTNADGVIIDGIHIPTYPLETDPDRAKARILAALPDDTLNRLTIPGLVQLANLLETEGWQIIRHFEERTQEAN